MKFKISVPDLQYALRLVKDVVPSTGPLAESVGVLISSAGNRAVFTAFSPQLMAKATVRVETEREGETAVPAALLWNAVSRFQPRNERGFGTSDIIISRSTKARKLTLSATTTYPSGSETPHKRVFPLLNHEFFPEVPPLDTADATFTIPAGKLMDGIDSVAYAVSADKAMFVFTGISMLLEPGKLTLAATNGVCLAEYTVGLDDYTGPKLAVVLPSPLAMKISKSFLDEDILSISVARGTMFISTPNLLLAGTLIGEEYPNYRELIPTPTTSAVINKHVFSDNLQNLSYQAADVEDSRVSVGLAGGQLSLECGGSTNTGIPVEFAGAASFDCNLRLLLLSVNNISGDGLRIGFAEGSALLHFSSAEESASGAHLVCLLVPLSRS